ncbi:MAG: hypothetical protein RID09_09380 [Coleofasciculus sp. G1-WW12-02]|uniref:hypothetical protein n=1 Tax=Coleofasciculus sp. G1-WW12-02 TaxID=3068483 RepID=UPI0032FF21A1
MMNNRELTSSPPCLRVVAGIPIIAEGVSWFVEQPYSFGFPHKSSGSSHPQA